MLRTHAMGPRVVGGATYQFFGTAVRTTVSIGSTAVLARLLVPADFGYVAMAMVVTEFAVLFANFGFSNLLIQRRTVTRLHFDTVFWASLALGVVLALAVFLASFLAKPLFAHAGVGDLLRVLCLNFVITSLATIPSVVLARLMKFRADFWIQAATVLLRAVLASGLAWAGYGVWSLVIASLGGTIVQTALALLVVPYFPRLRFHPQLLTSTWRTSSSYFGGGLLFYASMNLDLLLIGRQLGATLLGYYQASRSLTDEVSARIAIPLQRVLFPAISAMRSERERMQSMVIRSGRLIAAVVVPVGFGISATAPELVRVLYGPQWMATVPLLTMFGLSAALRAATSIHTPIFNAYDRVHIALGYNLVSVILLIGGLWMATGHGIEGVALVLGVTAPYSLLPFLGSLRLIGLGPRHAWAILSPPLLAAGIMWAAVSLTRGLSQDWGLSIPALLSLCVCIGASVYTAVLHLISKDYLKEFRELARLALTR